MKDSCPTPALTLQNASSNQLRELCILPINVPATSSPPSSACGASLAGSVRFRRNSPSAKPSGCRPDASTCAEIMPTKCFCAVATAIFLPAKSPTDALCGTKWSAPWPRDAASLRAKPSGRHSTG
nr:MAG TPA: hypothetical protein [Bacteriophage sp.]